MKIKSGLIIAMAAGSIAGLAQAEDRLGRIEIDPSGTATVRGHVYVNMGTGERVIASADAVPATTRGAGWSWSNAVIDPCFPMSAGDPDNDAVVWVFTGIHDATAGDANPPTPTAINYWSEWFEHPGDSIINGFTFGYFSTVLDPEEDGTVGHEFLFALTENDRITARSGAMAHSPLLVTELFGAPDTDGNGTVSFTEGNLWIFFLDFQGGDTPFSFEAGDTDGSAAGQPAGVDIDGDGLIDSGYIFGFRQPGVAEGDGMIDRFPELDSPEFRNPDGLDVTTFPNIVSVGTPLVHPSPNAGIDGDPDCYDPNADEWPQVPGCDDSQPFPLGAWDAFTSIDAIGVEEGVFFFGGFTCSPATPPPSPPFNTPWAGSWFEFNINSIDPGPQGCNPADIAEPFNVLDLADIGAFVTGFQAGDPIADLAPPVGVFDLADIGAFVSAFQAGCP